MKDVSTGKIIIPTGVQNQRQKYSRDEPIAISQNNKQKISFKSVPVEGYMKVEIDDSLSLGYTAETSITNRTITPKADLSFGKKTVAPPDVSLADISETMIMDMKFVNDPTTRVVGEGNFGEVTYAVVGEAEESIENYNKKRRSIKICGPKKVSRPLSVSRILVKKTPKDNFKISESMLRFDQTDKVMEEAEKNIIVGIDSKPLFLNPAVVTVFQGVELTKLCLPDQKLAEATKPLSYLDKLCIAHQITESIASLHAKGIGHQDLKLSNVLITVQGIISIIDNKGITVGEAENYKFMHKPSTKTLRYCPPEIINDNYYSIYDRQGYRGSTLAHDSWSLGIMLYEIFAEKKADEFFGMTLTKKLYLDYIELVDQLNQDIYLNSKVPTEIKDLIMGLLQYAPACRLTPKEVLACDIFNNDSYKKSAFALNVQHDKNYRKLLVLEKQLETAKKINDPVQVKYLQKEIFTIKTGLSEIKTLINNEVYRDIPKDVEFESKPLKKDMRCLAQVAILSKLLAKNKAEKKAILEDIQVHKSKVEKEISDINGCSRETTEKKADLIQDKLDEFQDLERQALLSIESIDESISQLIFEKQQLESQGIDASNERWL
jgi:serine/threonine protein kinase